VNPKDEARFMRQVRDAVAHLYDVAYLQRHPLAEALVPPLANGVRTRGQELRRIVLDAIEALNPGPSIPIRAPERRPYAILFGLYVEGRPQPEVAGALGIGGRQLRRHRAEAFEALAGILRDRYLPTATSAATPEPLREESERLAQGREPLDLHQLVDGLLPLLQALARERGVQVLSHVGPNLPQPLANRTLVRQVLIGLASQALTSLPLARLAFVARTGVGAVGIGLELDVRPEAVFPGEEATGPRLEVHAAGTLAAALGGALRQEVVTARKEQVWVLLPLQEETVVLVVDDNRELFVLFERYVAGRPFRLLHAAGAEEALSLARTQRPGIITIDLMMPGRDGWELLQTLRAQPETVAVPVIVCKKPVGQVDLLQALEAAQAQAWGEEGNRVSPAGS
jgi:CheY-like chemotaxis protein